MLSYSEMEDMYKECVDAAVEDASKIAVGGLEAGQRMLEVAGDLRRSQFEAGCRFFRLIASQQQEVAQPLAAQTSSSVDRQNAA